MPVYYYGLGDPDAKERFTYWKEHTPSAIAIDTETISLKERMPLGFAIAFSPDECFYFQVHPDIPPELELIKSWLADIRIVKIFQNAMFDLSVFPLIPVVGDILNTANLFDTNVAARLLGYVDTSLEMLADVHKIGIEPAGQLMKRFNATDMLKVPPMEVADHCQKDARATFRLWLEFKDKIHSQYPEYFNIEMQVIPILIAMSMKGITIDQNIRGYLSTQYQKDIEFYTSVMKQYGIDKPSSNQQVGYMLANRGNFLPFTRRKVNAKTGKYNKQQISTREEELEFLDDPLAAAVIGYRKKTKFKGTYLDPLEGQDRFYTNYYMDTSVGRLSSRDRNVQNIPLDARQMLCPDNGVFTTVDYQREHMYLLANFSKDRDMLEVLYDPDPERNDVHKLTAKKMNVTRKMAKTLNFAVAYGATAKTISEQAKIKDIRLCEKLIEDWFRAYPSTADWVKEIKEEGMRTGWAVPTLFGRRIKIQEEFYSNGKLNTEAMGRKCINFPVLGSDGEVIKRAIIKVNQKNLGPPVLALTVHDSLTFDGEVASIIPRDELEHIAPFRLPIDIKETLRWE